MPSLFCYNRKELASEVQKLKFNTTFPSKELQKQLNDRKRQRLLPFLGAGASLPPIENQTNDIPKLSSLDMQVKNEISSLIASIGLISDVSKDFLRIAIEIARKVDQVNGVLGDYQPQAWEGSTAPSAWQLATFMATMLEIEPYKPYGSALNQLLGNDTVTPERCLQVIMSVSRFFELDRSLPNLLTMGSYFPHESRFGLRVELEKRFECVTARTKIQKALALKAKAFVDERNKSNSNVEPSDYLIITTNYDRLIELELEELKVPYWVVTVGFDTRVYTAFSEASDCDLSATSYNDFCEKFEGDFSNTFTRTKTSPSCVLLYKVHGCPRIDTSQSANNIVIGDSDYVRFIESNGRTNEMIPSYIKDKMLMSRFLFLGYSFSDWNIRGFYENFTKRRGMENPTIAAAAGPTDYIVLRTYSMLDHLYFKKWNDDLSILVVDLADLARTIEPNLLENVALEARSQENG